MVNSVFFESTDHQEIVNICDSLRPGTAAGCDNIHMDVIKSTIDLISKPLARVINLSMASGIVPNELKITRVIPLFKSGDQGSLHKLQTSVSIAYFFQILREGYLCSPL